MDERLHPSFSKKDDLGITKNYRGIILSSIATKLYNALLFNRIKAEIEEILWKNPNDIWEN